ncbi:MAG: heavy metal-associated domain-containing protein [Candidatus Enteromonas sp.]|nr:heavy metal-associated domain-containing protein [Candidatus Enteromonas sp.]
MFGIGKRIVTVVKVDGMHCVHCAAKVEKALLGIPGVNKATVDLETKSARVISKQAIAEEAFKEAIESVGFVYSGAEAK